MTLYMGDNTILRRVSEFVGVGVDFGQAADYTALTVLHPHFGSKKSEDIYYIRDMHRFPLKTSYKDIARAVKSGLEELGNGRLAIELNGPGYGVRDDFRELKVAHFAVFTTGGYEERQHPEMLGVWLVPKRELIVPLWKAVQNGQLKFAKGLKHAEDFIRELRGMRLKTSEATGYERFEHREGEHDDLVISCGLALWRTKFFGGRTKDTEALQRFRETGRYPFQPPKDLPYSADDFQTFRW